VDNGPDKPVEEMTERETREWKEWLFAQGADPAPIREEASLSVPAYGWDKDRKAVIESVHGQRFLVKLDNGGLCRGPLLEAEVKIARAEPFQGAQELHPNLARPETEDRLRFPGGRRSGSSLVRTDRANRLFTNDI
jgi:hypothetical protein